VKRNEYIVGESAATFRGGGFASIASNSLSNRYNLHNEAEDLRHRQPHCRFNCFDLAAISLLYGDSTQPVQGELGIDNWSKKGIEFTAHEGRVLHGQGPSYAVANRGADHMYATSYSG
jgi:hypothetical protein